MKKTLAAIGLFIFPLAVIFCLMAFVMLSLGVDRPDFTPDRAIRATYIYRSVLVVSVLGIVASVVVLAKSKK